MVDEPLLGLAPTVARHTIEVLKQINQKGVTILFIEQNVQTAMSLAHRGYVLESGKVVIEGTSSELLNSGEIKRVFLGG
jgi:branched-chain amino acid transport system ATP-binding protein